MPEPFVRLAEWLGGEPGRTVFLGDVYAGTDLPRVCVLSGWDRPGRFPVEGHEHIRQRVEVEAVAATLTFHRPASTRRVLLGADATDADLLAAALERWDLIEIGAKPPTQTKPCPSCLAAGRHQGELCYWCQGTGRMRRIQ